MVNVKTLLLHSTTIGLHLMTILIFASLALYYINSDIGIKVEELDKVFAAVTVV